MKNELIDILEDFIDFLKDKEDEKKKKEKEVDEVIVTDDSDDDDKNFDNAIDKIAKGE